ncbi:MAG: FecR family protein [Mangrovibacterium sp.]
MNRNTELLKRFFSNRYSRNDYQQLKGMLQENDPALEELMQQHWDEYQDEQLTQASSLSATQLILHRNIQPQAKHRIIKQAFNHFSKIAAILIIPLLLALGFLYIQLEDFLFQQQVVVEVASPTGSRTSLNLPDGSTVWLNGDSHIRYPAVFNESREVEIQGEAFFKVQSDTEHPFLVKANGISVEATGTEFNVSAYTDDPEISVILKEGKVAVLNDQQDELKQMASGYQFRYNPNTNASSYAPVNAEGYAGWINGRLIFENANMAEVAKRLERWYGVNIEVRDPELFRLHFKATFIHENIEEALKLIQATATFDYEFEKRNMKEDGSFTDARIIITKK